MTAKEKSEWISSLPGRVGELETAWGFRAGAALAHDGACSWVAAAVPQNGGDVVLKIGVPHLEARHEASALDLWEGSGAVRLLRASDDGFSLLLERCSPGVDLWTLPVDDRDTIACEILPRLWREPAPSAPFDSLADTVRHWWSNPDLLNGAIGYDQDILREAREVGERLIATQQRNVLLHGDFHPGNVLAAGREPWLAIDPKPGIGDPAFDIAQWLVNSLRRALTPEPCADTAYRQIVRFSDRLCLDPGRIAAWAFVKSVGWDWGPATMALFHNLMWRWGIEEPASK